MGDKVKEIFNLPSFKLLSGGVWPARRLLSPVTLPSHCHRPSRRADINIVVKLGLQARQHKATRLYRIAIRATCL